MSVPDRKQATIWLKRIGYYRLSGYWYPCLERSPRAASSASAKPSVLDTFQQGTELKHAFDLYVFDKRLRLLFLDALERIEVALRVDIALLLGKIDPWAHREPSTFNRYFRTVDPKDSAVRHLKWLSYLDGLASRSREDFVQHFARKYKDPLPIWIAIELWDFGTLSALMSGMKDADLQSLAEKYHLPRRTMLTSWIDCLNYVRNICAHHGRLWNRALVVQPAPPRSKELPLLNSWATSGYAKTRLYAAAAIIQFLLSTISPNTTWSTRLKQCLAAFPDGPGLEVASAGFPVRWEQEPLWAQPNVEHPLSEERT